MSNAAAKSPTKIESEALALFNVASVDKIPAVLWALGLRETCSRCGGSGHYSRNAMGSTTCYKCNGRRESAAKLTKAVLEQARVKVEAGELDACRARGKAIADARRAIKALLAEENAAASYITDAWTAEDRARRPAEREDGVFLPMPGPLSRARSMSIAASRVAFETSLAVEFRNANPVGACRTIRECIAMQRELVAAWRAWEAAQRASFRGAARAQLAA